MPDPTDLTAVSLFAGIGAFDLAFARAGIRTVAAVEIDDAARGVLHDNFPGTTLFTDVRKVTADGIRAAGFVPDRGVLLGGWPCQGLSLAGRRLGLDDPRSGLFEQVVRLLAGLRPRWFCLENVPGLLSATCACPGGGDRVCHGACTEPHAMPGGACGPGRCMDLHGGAMGTVLGALAGLGYGVAYRVLDAQYSGVPQQRRRIVFVGCLGDWAAPAEVLLEPEGRFGHPPQSRSKGSRTSTVAALRASTGGPDDNSATGGRLITGTLTAGMGSNVGHPGDAGKDELVLSVTAAHLAATLTAGIGKASKAGRRSEDGTNMVAYAVRAEPGGVGQGHNTTYVFDWKTDGGDRARPNVSTTRTSSLQTEKQDAVYQCHGSNVGTMGTLRAGNGNTSGGVPFTEMQTAVRRLTPLECERLQGLPDNWSATSWGKPQADNPRYRQMGNALAVPVFQWVAERIAAADARLTRKPAN